MKNSVLYGRLIIWLTFLVALILQTIPWPGTLELLRPYWLLLVTGYWVMALPHRVNVGTALILGLLWDLLLGSTLGIHGVVMSVVIYIIAINFLVLRNMALWQQGVVIGILTVLGGVLEFFGEFLLNDVYFEPSSLWAGLVSGILWPWVFLLLRRIRRQCQIR